LKEKKGGGMKGMVGEEEEGCRDIFIRSAEDERRLIHLRVVADDVVTLIVEYLRYITSI